MSKTHAPRPGVGARNEAAAAAQQILVITIGDDEWRLAWTNLPLGERMLVRKWTGLPYSTFTGNGEQIDQDSLALLWCLARRAGGEKTLVFDDALVGAWEARLADAKGAVDLTVEDPNASEADDPEA